MLIVNGSQEAYTEGMTVAGYLELKKYRPDRVAVELNGVIVPKKQYDSRLLSDGDRMEVVSFVGGG